MEIITAIIIGDIECIEDLFKIDNHVCILVVITVIVTTHLQKLKAKENQKKLKSNFVKQVEINC